MPVIIVNDEEKNSHQDAGVTKVLESTLKCI